ncbi:glycosyltransferase [Caproiciproducens galactitolivorans]|uniref:4,4'-diaponeurosporenoate glycosyltransferase n=1 Tax=Caproiciproducens galactitolivorans TaxID=642589 RepID=A0A4Z0Y2A1_9FIRM|nr:glycosyltransferase [Caproiciproducens galactitolivorans]QEY34186.1 glycosyltransferase [Caproiciproducens galactitolivorans]TGJ78059.1 putative glycosyl transferase [Caproiciproducens galactitolivorans]
MQITKLSVIIPVKNIEREITGVLRFVAAQVSGLEAEFIVVDMGSSDKTVLAAVQFIKEKKLRGFVIQNGDGPVAAALNTGLQKSGGDYITFIFARRLYRDFLQGYLETAARTSADFVFGSLNEEEANAAERRMSKAVCTEPGTQYIKNIIKNTIHIDISAILIKRKFLFERKIRFFDTCSHGYAEEFVYNCLLSAEVIVQSPTILKRDNIIELKRGKLKPVGKNIFQHTDAMLRIYDILKTNYRDDVELIRLFERQKLPLTIMNGVDILLQEGMGYNAIRGYLRVAGYDKLLVTGKQTDKDLKRRITIWRAIPWMYKVKKIK